MGRNKGPSIKERWPLARVGLGHKLASGTLKPGTLTRVMEGWAQFLPGAVAWTPGAAWKLPFLNFILWLFHQFGESL